MKINREGQATVIKKEDYLQIRNKLTKPEHRLVLDLLYYTGERIGAVRQLTIESVYDKSMYERRQVRSTIVYAANTRKDRQTREVPVHPELAILLQGYEPYAAGMGWLFPSIRDDSKPMPHDTFDNAFRQALKRAHKSHLGISIHSFRRTFITTLHKHKVPIATISAVTGHRNLANLRSYIEVTDDDKKVAISCL